MINKINTISVNSRNQMPQKEPKFTGLGDGVLQVMQACERNPMVNVTVLDLTTAILPRTYEEGKTNPYAGEEAFRRESSGLIINCLIPSFIVLGIAKAIQRPIIGKDSKMSNSWADSETITTINKYWQEASEEAVEKDRKTLFKKGNEAKAYNTIKKILEDTKGADGKELKEFKQFVDKGDFDKQIIELTKKVFVDSYSKADRQAISDAYKEIVAQTKVSEHIKIGDSKKYASQTLESHVKELPRVLREIVSGRNIENAKHLVNAKSILGLGGVLALAVSAQPINRWITAKTSGKKGAPIYKDFTATEERKLSNKEKASLNKQKFISVASMIGVALLSMRGKFPKMNTLQFKGIFPTMDQARIISTFTFASRMLASEDKNDLREATIRDIATFSSFYFLGDYVAKGLAFLMERRKPDIKLINHLEELPKDAGKLKKLWHGISKTALKSSDEVIGKEAQRLRAYCQAGNIIFSLIALGIIIPKIYRGQTNKKREEELKKMGIDQQIIDKFYPHFMKNDPNFASKQQTYKNFFTLS